MSSSPPLSDTGFAAELVEAMSAVAGVTGAELSPDAQGGWGLLHLGLRTGTDEIGVAAAVGRLLRERFGLSVDAGAIALVEESAGLGVVAGTGVEVLRVSTAAHRVTSEVLLRRDGRQGRGLAQHGAGGNGVVRAVVEATVAAAEELVGSALDVDVDSVDVHTDDAPHHVRVALTLDPDGAARQLVGHEPLRADARQAAVRATLRLLADHLAEEPPPAADR